MGGGIILIVLGLSLALYGTNRRFIFYDLGSILIPCGLILITLNLGIDRFWMGFLAAGLLHTFLEQTLRLVRHLNGKQE